MYTRVTCYDFSSDDTFSAGIAKVVFVAKLGKFAKIMHCGCQKGRDIYKDSSKAYLSAILMSNINKKCQHHFGTVSR